MGKIKVLTGNYTATEAAALFAGFAGAEEQALKDNKIEADSRHGKSCCLIK